MKKLLQVAVFAGGLFAIVYGAGIVRGEDPCVEYTTEEACDLSAYGWQGYSSSVCGGRAVGDCNYQVTAEANRWKCKQYTTVPEKKTECIVVKTAGDAVAETKCATRSKCKLDEAQSCVGDGSVPDENRYAPYYATIPCRNENPPPMD